MTSENAKAKALLEQAGERLDEALDLVEECTDKHDTIGSACDDLDFVMNHLDFVMHQMWPNENSEPWLDGTDPMKHAADCAMFLAEVTGEEDGAPSTGLVAEAMENVWEAATLLWGDKWKATMDGRLQAKAQAMGLSLDTDGTIDTLEATENLTNAMYKRASEFPIASREDAIDALMDAAESTAALVGTLIVIADNVGEQAGAALIRASKEAGNANMQTLRAIGYLNKCQAESGKEA